MLCVRISEEEDGLLERLHSGVHLVRPDKRPKLRKVVNRALAVSCGDDVRGVLADVEDDVRLRGLNSNIYHHQYLLVERTPAHDKTQGRSQSHREAWPSRSAVWVVDMHIVLLYAAKVSTRSSILILFREEEEDVDAVELQVAINDLPWVKAVLLTNFRT